MKHLAFTAFLLCCVGSAYAERQSFGPSGVSGTVKVDDGTAAAPSLTFTSDDNTGFYLFGTDQVACTLNGTTTGVFSGGQLVLGSGFGSTPGNGTVKGVNATGTNVAGGNFIVAGGASTGNAAGGYLAFQTAAAGGSGSSVNALTERMRITTAGTVIIGNGETAASPTSSSIRATSGTGTNITGANLDIYGGGSTGSGGGGVIRFYTSPNGASGSAANTLTERMRITASGAIHIGNGENSASPATGSLLGTNGSGTNIAGGTFSITSGRGTGTGAGGPITFSTSAAGSSGSSLNAATERFRIDSAGVFLAASGSYVDAGAGKLELPNGTTIPATCTVGELFHDTDSNDCVNTGGGDGALCICKTTNTWALITNF